MMSFAVQLFIYTHVTGSMDFQKLTIFQATGELKYSTPPMHESLITVTHRSDVNNRSNKIILITYTYIANVLVGVAKCLFLAPTVQ